MDQALYVRFAVGGTRNPLVFIGSTGTFIEGYAIEQPDGSVRKSYRGELEIWGGRLEVVKKVIELGAGHDVCYAFVRVSS